MGESVWRARLQRWWLPIAVSAWLITIAIALGLVLQYKSTAGKPANAPRDWPAQSALPHPTDRASLVMFVHPHCACSRASLTELGHTLGRVPGLVRAHVVFVSPEGVTRDWSKTDLRDAVQQLSSVEVHDDFGGTEAKVFGANISGTTVLYDKNGHLLFAGGITALRGHEGNSFGQERIVALLETGHADRHDSPVFGCELDDNEGETTHE